MKPILTNEITNEDTGERFYYDQDNLPYISVTTLCSRYEDKTGIYNWQNRIGLGKANAIRDEASVRGTYIHDKIEKWLAAPETKELTVENPYDVYFNLLISKFYSRIKFVSSEEAVLVNYEGKYRYAGRYDTLVQLPEQSFMDEYSEPLLSGYYLVDIKTKNNLPRLDNSSFILKNLLQASAYYYPLSQTYDIQGFFLLYVSNKKLVNVLLTKEKLEKLFKLFLYIVKDYYAEDVDKYEKGFLWKAIQSKVDAYYDEENQTIKNLLPEPIFMM